MENSKEQYNTAERPFRVGKKQGRAVLAADGTELVVFNVGMEDRAQEYCDMLNEQGDEKKRKATDHYTKKAEDIDAFIVAYAIYRTGAMSYDAKNIIRRGIWDNESREVYEQKLLDYFRENIFGTS